MTIEKPMDLKIRTRDFALRIIRLYSALPRTTVSQVLGKQILRSGTSVGAQFREGIRAKSDADFISKLEGALQELEETCYWMELIERAQLLPAPRLTALHAEAGELTAILVSMVKSVKIRRTP